MKRANHAMCQVEKVQRKTPGYEPGVYSFGLRRRLIFRRLKTAS